MNYAYFQMDDDCTICGARDGAGPLEVMIAPNGNIAVFSDK